MISTKECWICGNTPKFNEFKSDDKLQYYWVSCPKCGVYGISAEAVEVLSMPVYKDLAKEVYKLVKEIDRQEFKIITDKNETIENISLKDYRIINLEELNS
ncbi:hypothetical protein [Desulfoluna butyratoxydans]|uniref:Uncharacterized protein n=1 Tax=Desulfoluna butyratoxydans TaxID=231438 RepID=A0A4U8YSH7_9BACT|nr:hypothetical protein [Desulfoluna butyratoxydans]VFQ46900.1 hypothetical protein MSL71_45820 [Desulfoluna butyratoxydans]